MMNKYLILSLIFLLLLPSVFAGYFDNWWRWLHIPPEYTKAPDLLYFLVVPFLAVWAITWGLLTRIQIFNSMKKINMLLSLLFAIATIYYGWIFKLVHLLLTFGTTFSFIAFMVIFVIGITLFARKKTKVIWKGSALKELKDNERELKRLRRDLRNATEEAEKNEINAKIDKVEARITALRTEIERKPQDD